MRKIIFTMLVASSTVLFAKTEEPKIGIKKNRQENETVLVAKKNLMYEQFNHKIEIQKTFSKAAGMDSQTCYIIVTALSMIQPIVPNYSLCDALAEAGF